MDSNETLSQERETASAVADREKKAFPRQAIQFIVRMVATALVLWLLLTFAAGVFLCHSDACYPMIKDGDLCVTWKLSAPSSGNMIIYSLEGKTRFGRVAAVGGDKVEIKNNALWVNGFVAVQELICDQETDVSAIHYPYTVPEKSVFVICDNTASREDSRTFGAVPLDGYQGRVVFLIRRRGI